MVGWFGWTLLLERSTCRFGVCAVLRRRVAGIQVPLVSSASAPARCHLQRQVVKTKGKGPARTRRMVSLKVVRAARLKGIKKGSGVRKSFSRSPAVWCCTAIGGRENTRNRNFTMLAWFTHVKMARWHVQLLALSRKQRRAFNAKTSPKFGPDIR